MAWHTPFVRYAHGNLFGAQAGYGIVMHHLDCACLCTRRWGGKPGSLIMMGCSLRRCSTRAVDVATYLSRSFSLSLTLSLAAHLPVCAQLVTIIIIIIILGIGMCMQDVVQRMYSQKKELSERAGARAPFHTPPHNHQPPETRTLGRTKQTQQYNMIIINPKIQASQEVGFRHF